MWLWHFTWSSSPHICCSRSARPLVLYSRWNAQGWAGGRHTVIQASPHLRKEKNHWWSLWRMTKAYWSAAQDVLANNQTPQIKSKIDQTMITVQHAETVWFIIVFLPLLKSLTCLITTWGNIERENLHKQGQKLKNYEYTWHKNKICYTSENHWQLQASLPSHTPLYPDWLLLNTVGGNNQHPATLICAIYNIWLSNTL